jgi:hypothetical protein
MQMGGSWSVYWYNGKIVSSEIARGLDVFELEANPLLTEHEIAAANTVKFDQLNPQDQPHYSWPASFALAHAYVDQLDRDQEISTDNISSIRQNLLRAENSTGADQADMLNDIADDLDDEMERSSNPDKVEKLADTLRELSTNP